MSTEESERALVEKLRELPPNHRAEVEDFIDFLRMRSRDRRLTGEYAKRSEEVLRRVWENPEDADYDRL